MDSLSITQHFDDRLDTIEHQNDERFATMQENIKEHFRMCNELCISKIGTVNEKADKAHERLDRQKGSIECLDAYKNKNIGFQRAIVVVMGLISIALTYLGVRGR